MVKITDLFDLEHTAAKEYLSRYLYPWQALPGLRDFIQSLGTTLDPDEYDEIAPEVWVHKTARIAPTAYLGSPCIIGAETEVRHCAFIRSTALIGKNCVVGNSCELKNVILFDGVHTPHFNYVGDSILGYKAHLGAGAVAANVKLDRKSVVIREGKKGQDTGLRKCGAMLGDHAEVGCNSVLNPGTVIGRNSKVYPHTSVRGTVPENSIYKSRDAVVTRN